MYNNLRRSFKSRRDGNEDSGFHTDPAQFSDFNQSFHSHSSASTDGVPRYSEFSQIGSRPSLPPAQLFASSTFSPQSWSRSRRNEPLGLHVIHEPPGDRTADIIFVHGLGGSSQLSWSYNKDLSLFWPKEWLPSEPGFKDVRLLTFGYNAHFMSQSKDMFNVSDFAKDLLMQMRFGNDENVRALNIGQVPIIFVAHSMGGLVVKKAYILGSQDNQYRDILDRVQSIVFLATPHRGSNLADTLKTFLSASFQSPKQYVSDLQKNSAMISDINDQFKLHAEKFQLVSFFETQPASIGIRKAIVVERDSAILDYPNEISSPLNANHHTVSKFASRTDPNYVTVRNVVKSLVEKSKIRALIASKTLKKRLSLDQESFRSFPSADELMNRLGVAPRPSDTLDTLMEQYVWGSCDWILSDSSFKDFLDNDSLQPLILHIQGQPGAGKSVLASFLIQHLDSLDLSVQFWYFRHDDQLKRSNRQCLLSLAFQTMYSFPEYSQRLLALAQDIHPITRSDIRTLWQKLFVNLLDKLGGPDSTQLYWVLDAVDESESSQAFLALLPLIKDLRFPLRVIFLTRFQTVTRPLEKLRNVFTPDRMTHIIMSPPQESLRLFISEVLDSTPWEHELKEWITTRLLRKSQGSFLWLSLVMRELVSCDTREQLDDVLDETPEELFDMYHRIEKAVARELRKADAPLVKAILSWITCSERQLSEDELKEALRPGFSLLNLRHTTSRLCGDFVAFDRKGNLSLVHYTAKEFLLTSATDLGVNSSDAHTLIFQRCLSVLTDPRFRIRLRSQGCTGLLRYCCLSWSHHMARAGVVGFGDEYIRKLAAFFTSSAALAWIDAVATAGQLQVLTSTAKALTVYVENFRRAHTELNPLLKPPIEIEFLGLWSTELIRIVGKFGKHLLEYPSCIYSLVPLFCPAGSVISQYFGPQGDVLAPRITGIANHGWDDSLAKFTIGQGKRSRAIFCNDSSFGVVTADKAVYLYNASTFQRTGTFPHNETIVAAQFNLDGTMMVTGGLKSVKVWDVTTGRELYSYPNPDGMRAMAATFTRDSSEILVLCVDSNLRRQMLSESSGWVRVHWQMTNEPGIGRGGGTPVCVAFSPDGTHIAISHRTAPLTVWNTETGNRIGRSDGRRGLKITRNDNVDYAIRLAWSPGATEHVVGIFTNGTIFKWFPPDPHHEEMENSVVATEIACSPDGRLIVTAQKDGSLGIWSFDSFTALYSLTCMRRAHAVAVSPDGRRIYDLRHSSCNVWEPNALIRMAEQDEKSSDTASSHYDNSTAISLVSEAAAVMLEPVTAVCFGASTTAFAFGTGGGVVKYFPAESLEGVDVACSPSVITCLAISNGGNYLAYATIHKRAAVRRTGNIEEQPIFEMKCENPIAQLVVDATEQHLAVRFEDSFEIWSLSTKTLVSRRANVHDLRYWISHPFKEATFVSISTVDIESCRVSDLTPTHLWTLSVTPWAQGTVSLEAEISAMHLDSIGEEIDPKNPNPILSVERVFLSPKQHYMLIQSSPGTAKDGGLGSSQYTLLDMSFLSLADQIPSSKQLVSGRLLPKAVSSLINIPLGFVLEAAELRRGSRDPVITAIASSHGGERCSLAFIDRDFWVRSWSLDDGEGNCKKHFFLPQDWVNMECLLLSLVTPDGRFLCPRNGEVAVLHNGLTMEGVEQV